MTINSSSKASGLGPQPIQIVSGKSRVASLRQITQSIGNDASVRLCAVGFSAGRVGGKLVLRWISPAQSVLVEPFVAKAQKIVGF
jgi:hypothetical protein